MRFRYQSDRRKGQPWVTGVNFALFRLSPLAPPHGHVDKRANISSLGPLHFVCAADLKMNRRIAPLRILFSNFRNPRRQMFSKLGGRDGQNSFLQMTKY